MSSESIDEKIKRIQKDIQRIENEQIEVALLDDPSHAYELMIVSKKRRLVEEYLESIKAEA